VENERKPDARPDEDLPPETAEEAARTADETGITEDQARQLARAVDEEGTELDSAAEAAARCS
jgi:hypothetical protein